MTNSKIDWGVDIKVGNNYNIPKGMLPTSYTTFESIMEELKLSHENRQHLQLLGQELAKNTSHDFWVRIGVCASSVIVSGVLLMTKLRRIRELIRRNNNRVDPLASNGISLPMYQAHLT